MPSKMKAACKTRFVVLSLCLFASFQAPSYSQRPSAQPTRLEIDAAMTTLPESPSGFGQPCSYRSSWEKLGPRLSFLSAEAQKDLKTPLPAFDEAAYLQFTKSGDRQPMEKNLSARMNQLVPLVLAECADYHGRYISRIAEVMDSLAAMPSWTLSAHDPLLLNLHGTRYFVDLNAADMADTLAETLYLLGEQIPLATRSHVMRELERHIFAPMRDSFEASDPGYDHNSNWWLYAEMNWNAVCLKGVTGAALAVLPRKADRALFVAAAEHYIQNYEDGFNPDGYDTEGLGYWNYGFSHFIELRENLMRISDDKIDLLESAKMKKVALFGVQFPMMPGNAAAFGDAGLRPKADQHLLQMIHHIFQIPPDEVSTKEMSSGVQHAGLTSIALDLFPIPGDELPNVGRAVSNQTDMFYADSGVLVSYPGPGQELAVTIKAGGNTTHSHNDVGSFVIGLGDTQPVGDPGGPGYYTAETFSSHRLDSKLLNSFGHPVPEIDGHLQLDATKVKVKVLSHSFSQQEDRIVIDLNPAYELPEVTAVTRTLVHSRKGAGEVVITDDFHISKPLVIIESLPTHGVWQKLDDQTLLFIQGGKKLRVTVQASAPATFGETTVTYNGNTFTRVEAKVLLQTSSKIALQFTPVVP